MRMITVERIGQYGQIFGFRYLFHRSQVLKIFMYKNNKKIRPMFPVLMYRTKQVRKPVMRTNLLAIVIVRKNQTDI